MEPTNPMVDHPQHYTQGGIECIDAIQNSMGDEAFRGYLQGNAMKYLWRYDKKGKPTEDLDKAVWYISKLKEEIAKLEERSTQWQQ